MLKWMRSKQWFRFAAYEFAMFVDFVYGVCVELMDSVKERWTDYRDVVDFLKENDRKQSVE